MSRRAGHDEAARLGRVFHCAISMSDWAFRGLISASAAAACLAISICARATATPGSWGGCGGSGGASPDAVTRSGGWKKTPRDLKPRGLGHPVRGAVGLRDFALLLADLVPTIAGGGVVIQGWDEHPGSDADRPDGAGAV